MSITAWGKHNEFEIQFNEQQLSSFIKAHLNCFHNQVLSAENIDKLLEQIVESFGHFMGNKAK